MEISGGEFVQGMWPSLYCEKECVELSSEFML